MKAFALIAGLMVLDGSALAAGIDSRTIACAQLQTLIAARGYVFISQPVFGDFAVANVSYCPGGTAVLQRRSVPTTDQPECLIDYCISRSVFGGAG